jgi:hypothetical protein
MKTNIQELLLFRAEDNVTKFVFQILRETEILKLFHLNVEALVQLDEAR